MVAKRQAESAADLAAKREQKRARLERKARGHAPVPKRGEDPAHDQTEKQLARLATRCAGRPGARGGEGGGRGSKLARLAAR